jgi:hypothetical protein
MVRSCWIFADGGATFWRRTSSRQALVAIVGVLQNIVRPSEAEGAKRKTADVGNTMIAW